MQFDTSTKTYSFDTKFVCDLLELCPSMHLDRTPIFFKYPNIIEKWVEVGKFFPHSLSDLPKEYLMDEKIQGILQKRFEGTENYDVLLKRFSLAGVVFDPPKVQNHPSQAKQGNAHANLSDQIKNASSRTRSSQQHPKSKEQEPGHNL